MFGLTFFAIISLSSSYDLNGVIGTGQSLAVGGHGEDFYTSSNQNFKLSLGSKEKSWPLSTTDSEFKLVALTEPIRSLANTFPGPYPNNLWGNTGHAAMANQMEVTSVHSVVGESGQGMDKIRKGANDDGSTGRAYAASIFEIETILNLAQKAGKTYGVGAIVLTHGESDSGSSSYQGEILQFWKNYTADIRSITGQKEDPILIVSQQHRYGFAATLAAWKVQQDAPGSIFCSGPKYQYDYYEDNTHLLSNGYDDMGKKYGEIYNEVVLKGNKDWRPLQPIKVAAVDRNTLNVTFNVPNPPLVWDNTLPSPAAKSQWRNGRGFEVSVNNNAVEISSAEISGSSVLIITSQSLPSGTPRVGYAAAEQTARNKGTVRWGLLKDSDPIQANWAISFEMDAS